MMTKNACPSRQGVRVHWMTILSALLCIVAVASLIVMINPALFGYPFFLGAFPFFCFTLSPLLAIVVGILALVRPQHSYGKALAKMSILMACLLMLIVLVLIYYATQFS